MIFSLNGITQQEFLETYWRKKPLFVKGGAKALGLTLSEAEFRAITREMEETHRHLVYHTSDDFIRAQNLDVASEKLRHLSYQISSQMSWPNTWVDGVLAGHGDSIGCHYDDSDNFVLQQSGTKIWRLHSPEILPMEELRQLMLRREERHTNIDDLQGNSLEFVVEAGDLLYIPVFWPHWGISQGPSFSLSLVCNTENALGLLPLLYWILSENPEWWKPMPIPQVADPASDKMLPTSSQMDRFFDCFFAALGNKELQQRVKEEWWKARYERIMQFKKEAQAVPSASSGDHLCK
jgi:ribosomal protein L16 Arg81 hydroxylase